MAPTSKLSQGIKRASRSHAYHRRGLWAIKAKHGGAFPKAEKPAAGKEPKFYPADDVKPRAPTTRKHNPPKLRCRPPPPNPTPSFLQAAASVVFVFICAGI
jgi:large subunit ribosomal protein L6e